jgi:hypothetical protein
MRKPVTALLVHVTTVVIGGLGCSAARPSDVLSGLPATPRMEVARTADASLRVLVPSGTSVTLGACAGNAGALRQMTQCASTLEQADLKAGSPLGEGLLRVYSNTLSADGFVSGSAPVVKGDAAIKQRSHELVIEWSRTRTQGLSANASPTGFPLITDVEVGVAVRVLFTVTATDANASLSANFGYGDLAQKLAEKEVAIRLSYRTLGVGDMISAVPQEIQTVEQLFHAQNTFYEAIRTISRALERFQMGKPLTPDSPDSTKPPAETLLQQVKAPKAFDYQVIAYRVSGVENGMVNQRASYHAGYLDGVRLLVGGESCAEALKSGPARRDESYATGLFDAFQGFAQCSAKAATAEQQDAARLALQAEGEPVTTRKIRLFDNRVRALK